MFFLTFKWLLAENVSLIFLYNRNRKWMELKLVKKDIVFSCVSAIFIFFLLVFTQYKSKEPLEVGINWLGLFYVHKERFAQYKFQVGYFDVM